MKIQAKHLLAIAISSAFTLSASAADDKTALMSDYAARIFRNLDCHGVVRVDFILSETDGIPYFLEVNTIPGQTAMSIVPGQVEYNKLDIKEFYTKMVMEAFELRKLHLEMGRK